MKTIAIIPARAGSKGIPHKNVAEVAGKPLVAWSIELARLSRHVSRVIVSTDSEDYARIARRYGAETPFLRPPEISGDQARDLDVFLHALEWLACHEGYRPDICVHLRPTYPLRRAVVLDELIDILIARPDLDSVRTVTPVHHPPFKMWFRAPDGLLTPVVTQPAIRDAWNEPRQGLPQAYLQNANIDVMYSRVILEQRSMSGRRIYGYVEDTFFDIDTPAEMQRVSRVLERESGSQDPVAGKVFCFDIDGIIASLVPDNDYRRCQPIPASVKRICKLRKRGARIVLYTARGSVSGIDWHETTARQMEAWGVPYDALHFGKPAADYYVDDRMIMESEIDDLLADRGSPKNGEKP